MLFRSVVAITTSLLIEGTDAAAWSFGLGDLFSSSSGNRAIEPIEIAASLCMTEGVENTPTVPFPSDALIVNGYEGERVSFTITQSWLGVAGFGITYDGLHNGRTRDSHCLSETDVPYKKSQDFEGVCVEGIHGIMVARVTIVVFTDVEFRPDESEACNVDDLSKKGENFCAYRIEIPCGNAADIYDNDNNAAAQVW